MDVDEDKKDEILDFSRSCPYLDTVDRTVLDFDFEKICSLTLANFNVYACLACGKYFQGRGRSSPAYFHCLNEDHHIYIHLHTQKIYCLPENYQVIDSSLGDIKAVLNPTFGEQEISSLDVQVKSMLDLSKKLVFPGYVGLNNIKANDYVNVVVQSLAHIRPLRNFFLRMCELETRMPCSHLARCFGELVRRMWNSRPFKGQVSPHELLQAISSESNKKYSLNKQEDAHKFLLWMVNHLKAGLGSVPGIMSETFQGTIRVSSRKPADPSIRSTANFQEPPKILDSPFFILTLDLPPAPLFHDEFQLSIIPQMSIFDLLLKYNESTPQDLGNVVKQYKIISLPKYLVFHINRFKKNQWKLEKLRTIVHFPLEDLEMKSENGAAKYRIIANIVFEGQDDPTNGAYKLYILHKAKGQWFEMQDLSVREVLPQTIFISESYIQIWEQI